MLPFRHRLRVSQPLPLDQRLCDIFEFTVSNLNRPINILYSQGILSGMQSNFVPNGHLSTHPLHYRGMEVYRLLPRRRWTSNEEHSEDKRHDTRVLYLSRRSSAHCCSSHHIPLCGCRIWPGMLRCYCCSFSSDLLGWKESLHDDL
jgi:hypothetical protein